MEYVILTRLQMDLRIGGVLRSRLVTKDTAIISLPLALMLELEPSKRLQSTEYRQEQSYALE